MRLSLSFFLSFGSHLFVAPESAELLRNLGFPVELEARGQRHEKVDDHEVVVNGHDLQAVLAPDDTGGEDGDLLIRGNQVSWLLQVPDVRDRNHPFKSWSPEKN
jgi:hypothetical protein